MVFPIHRRVLLYILIFPVIFSFLCQGVYGEGIKNTGYKYFKNYSYLDYDHHPQNWCIVQDRKGVIYVGNLGGVLVFDGVTWELIEIPNMLVRSMAVGKDNRIYIGGKDEFGYIAPDSRGFPKYVSLTDHFDRQHGNISDVWNTASTEEGIYFRTRGLLFRWNHKEIDMYRKGSFGPLYLCEGKLLIQQSRIGLVHVNKTVLSPLPGTTALGREKIWMLVPFDSSDESNSLLLATWSKGLTIYKKGTLFPFNTNADEYLREKKISHGIRLSTGDFAVTTFYGGIVILDSRGRIKHIFNKVGGLQNNNIKFCVEDNLGNVWLALAKGISRLEFRSPFYHYDERLGLGGAVLTVKKHKNNLYAGTTQGLFVLHEDTGTFNRIAGVGTCLELLSTGASLLVATANGIYQLDSADGIPRKLHKAAAFRLVLSRLFPNHIWCATEKGLIALVLKDSNWTEGYKYKNLEMDIRRVTEDTAGCIWLVSAVGNVLRVTFPNGIADPSVSRYERMGKLYEDEIFMAEVEGHVVFTSRNGLFRFDEKNNTFIPDLLLGKKIAYNRNGENIKQVFRVVQDRNRNIWFHSKSRNYRAVPGPGNAFVIEEGPLRRIPIIQTNEIFPDPDGRNIWFGGVEGLIRYESASEIRWDKEFPTIIRKVFVNDSIPVFGIYKNDLKAPVSIPKFPFKERNISFQCGALFFEKESAALFRYKLDGYDSDWSEWTSESRKHYTNLDAGGYTFHVQAKNVYDVIGKEDNFSFRVLPPWYLTWWAFVLYGIGLLLAFNYAVKWRSRQVIREKEKLERVVEERTLQLKEQSEKLKEMDRIKSRFFANISHEFRTPLTLIVSPLEQMLHRDRDETQKKSYRLMLRNAQQLLTLINRLLELARIDSGKMKLHTAYQNIVTLLKSVVTAFREAARQKRLTLDFQCEKEEILLYFDLEKLEEVMYNLLSNAVKFTPPGGRITVSVSLEPRHVRLSVKDTGTGIPEEQLGHVFDRFFQAGLTKDKTGQGTGIGLSLTKELISLHRGEIEVHSGEERGTDFVIRLPFGKDHLSDEEIEAAPTTTSDRDIRKEIAAMALETEDENGGLPERKETAAASEEGEKISILVVEDHDDMRKHIHNMLEPHYTVIEAVDGKEGIGKAKEFMPDLIISDVMMPGIDGYQLCRTLKEEIKTCHIPIVLLTARASEDSVVKGLETGADDYVAKPFNEKMLRVRLKNLIDLRRQMQLKIQREKMLLPSEIPVTSQDDQFLKEFQAVIEKNLDDPDFNIEVLGKKLLIGRGTLFRKIQALTGETPNQFIQSYRLERGAQLLRENYGNVTEVAMAVGFSSPQYFSKCFREKFHQSPKAFQASETKNP